MLTSIASKSLKPLFKDVSLYCICVKLQVLILYNSITLLLLGIWHLIIGYFAVSCGRGDCGWAADGSRQQKKHEKSECWKHVCKPTRFTCGHSMKDFFMNTFSIKPHQDMWSKVIRQRRGMQSMPLCWEWLSFFSFHKAALFLLHITRKWKWKYWV